MRTKLPFLGALLLAAALAFSAAPALAGNGGFGPVPPESENAEGISTTYWVISAFMLFIFLLVEGLLVAFVLRFRRRRRARDADGAQIHGSTRLETMWTLGPVLILFVIAAVVFVKLPGIRDVPEANAGDEPLTIEVSGRQFYWQYRYPNGVVAVNRLRAPVGETVRLVVSAPDWDVIHSWWIPALGGKFDAIPGQQNVTWFNARREGVFRGQCAELCGLQHTVMLAEVEVMAKPAFDAWLEERADAQRAAAAEPLGEELYLGACATCHGIAGEGNVAAQARALQANPIVTDRAAVETILRNGRNRMPSVGRDWTDEQLDALVAYMKENLANGG